MLAMARALQQGELAAGRLGECDPATLASDRVGGALDHQHRAADTAAQPARGLLVEHIGEFGRDEGLRRRVQAPADAVLSWLGRVRFGEHLGEEELQEAPVVAQPVVAVVLRPALIGAELLVPVVRRAVHRRCGERQGWGDEDGSGHPVRVPGRQQQRALRPERQRHDHRAPGPGRLHHCQGVGGKLALVVAGRRAV
jgi:hypothetical protein